MSALEEILGTFAVGHALEHGGKTFTFNRVDQRTKVALTASYFKRARETVYAVRELCSDEQYGALLKQLTDEHRRGHYDFPNGESYAYFMEAGLSELVRHLTGCSQEDAEGLCMERTIDVMHVALCVITASFPDLKKKMLRGAASGEIQMEKLQALLAPESIPTTPPPTVTPSPDSRPPASSRPAYTPTSSPG